MARANRRDVLAGGRFRLCIALIGVCGGRFFVGKMSSPGKTMAISAN